jgi:hypothetical protein
LATGWKIGKNNKDKKEKGKKEKGDSALFSCGEVVGDKKILCFAYCLLRLAPLAFKEPGLL